MYLLVFICIDVIKYFNASTPFFYNYCFIKFSDLRSETLPPPFALRYHPAYDKYYEIGEAFQLIPTHYPKLDTIRFYDHTWKDSTYILCNFKPDTSYSLFFNCCATIDINPSSKWNNDSLGLWDYENEFEKYQNVLMDLPDITLSISNGSETDSIYGWYVDYACFPSFKLLTKNGWSYGKPVKCFYWNNISTFLFFRSGKNYDRDKDENGVIRDVYPEDYYELARVTIRIFDEEKYKINYDVKNKKILLKPLNN